MFCTSCGKKNSDAARFCFSCGAALGNPRSAVATRAAQGNAGGAATSTVVVGRVRPGVISLLAVLHFIGAALGALLAIGIGAVSLLANDNGGAVLLVVAAGLGLLAGLEVVCGVGLWGLKSYGRTIQIVWSIFGLLAFPIGTIIAVLLLMYLNKPGVRILFSGTPPDQWTIEEATSVATTGQGSAVAIAIVGLFLAIPFVGIIAAIAVPGLLRARMSGNEALAIGALRAINAAQSTFAATCGKGGYAESLEDLARPPGGSTLGFVPGDLSTTGVVRNGYVVMLMRDERAVAVSDRPETCNGSVAISAYFAEAHPLTIGTTGQRSFAIDARGTIYFRNSGDPIEPGMDGASIVQ